MSMFCFQCQETARGKGCDIAGVCGKKENTAKTMDLLIYALKGVSSLVVREAIDAKDIPEMNREVLTALFMTITNANFDDDAIYEEINRVITLREKIRAVRGIGPVSDAADFTLESDREKMLVKASGVGVLATENEDIRSLREMIIYGLKGMAAYTKHAAALGYEDPSILSFIYKALDTVSDDKVGADELVALTLQTGEFGVKAMALLDKANTASYGNPEISRVNIGVRGNPAILISGHDLSDLEQLLEQTKGTGVDVYTHSEMLPAHYYPSFKKYENLVGNYGNAWWKQPEEFASFHGPILFTTNCIVPPKSEEIRDRIFTTGAAGFPGCRHITPSADGKKDFSALIALAKTLPAPSEIESGEIVGGFAHEQVFALSEKVMEAVRSGAIKKFFVMAGCDGRSSKRSYYTEFAEKLPADTVILTAGCAKYRYNKLALGDIGGIPRVLDAGQCNDSYSLALIALKLKEVFALEDINELPIVYNIAWYEQKAVIVLLALLSLGVKNIHLGPTLPGFLSPNVANVLVNTFGIAGIGTPDEDILAFLGSADA